MARFLYTLALMGLSAGFVAPSHWIQGASLALYLLHVSSGGLRAVRWRRWWSALSLASFYVGQGAIVPMAVLAWSERREELAVWVILALTGVLVNTVCRTTAWVQGVRIAGHYPDRGSLGDFVRFRWLDLGGGVRRRLDPLDRSAIRSSR